MPSAALTPVALRSPPIVYVGDGARGLQRDGEQRGGRGLAVRAGDRDDAAALHQRGHRGGPGQHGEAAAGRLGVLGVVGLHRGRHDDRVAAGEVVEVPRVVADVHGRAEVGQRGEGRRRDPVAAAHRRAARDQHPRDAREPGAADADQVHPAEAHRPVSRITRASFSSASRGISAGGGGAHRREPVEVGGQRRHVGGDPGGVEVGVLDHDPAAGGDHARGVALLLAVADRQRHVDRREPDRRGLGDAVGAGPAEREVGGGVGEVHPVDVVEHDVRRRAGGRRRGGGPAVLALRVQHLDAGGGERRRGRRRPSG